MKKLFYALPLVLLTANSYAVDARRYSIIPDDMNLVELQYMSVSTEKQLPNTAKVKNDSDSLYVRYLRTFNVFDDLAAVYVKVPYTHNNGTLNAGPYSLNQKQNGSGDAQLFFTIGLYNTPALSREDFAKFNQNGFRAGYSVLVNLPTGTYDKSKLFNIGSNQHYLKNELIATYTKDNFVAEFMNSITTYGDNNEYYGGTVKTQKDMYQSELHLTYNFTPKFWSGIDAFYLHGGESSVNGVSSRDKQNNTMVGLVANYNIGKGQYIKANYIKTVSAPQYAAKSDLVVLTFQQLF